eukprot:TRINITY_DN17306_c0_g1_i1.p1 TRINITY_DN17306_c0_g1~~TRINITY_DN17306_c0_g1_i1.p1  ORF type:complete len:730 (+),score=232.02 TRINITY_DN17306_c0_g1_i1:103-2292(+)
MLMAAAAVAAAAAVPIVGHSTGEPGTVVFRFTPCCTPADNCTIEWTDMDFPTVVPNPPSLTYTARGRLHQPWVNPEFEISYSGTIPEHLGPFISHGPACDRKSFFTVANLGMYSVNFPPCPADSDEITITGRIESPIYVPSGVSFIGRITVRQDGQLMGCWEGTVIGQASIPKLRVDNHPCDLPCQATGTCPVSHLIIPQTLQNPPSFSLTTQSQTDRMVNLPMFHVQLTLVHGDFSLTTNVTADAAACGTVTYDFPTIGEIEATWPACPWQAGPFGVTARIGLNLVAPTSALPLYVQVQAEVYDSSDHTMLSCINPRLTPLPYDTDEGGGELPHWIPYAGAAGGLLLVAFCGLAVLRWRTCAQLRQAHPAVSRYELLRRIGSGSYGVVYLVRRRSDSAQFALKYVDCDTDERQEDAMREFEMLRVLRGHPAVVELVETFVCWRARAGVTELLPPPSRGGGDSGGSSWQDEQEELVVAARQRYVCIVMPYFRRGDLADFVEGYGSALPEPLLLSIMRQLTDLLSFAHSLQPPVIHRDLKPANVLMHDDGRRVVVTDFGLARRLDVPYCSSRTGTLAYLSPECWAHHYGTENDVWSLGCVMYASAVRRVVPGKIRIMFTEAGNPDFHSDLRRELTDFGYSDFFSSLITDMLTVDYHLRPAAKELHERLVTGDRGATRGGDPAVDSGDLWLPGWSLGRSFNSSGADARAPQPQLSPRLQGPATARSDAPLP